MSHLHLYENTPSASWEQAYPLGNGRMGAIVWNSVQTEKIQLNEDTLWAGKPDFSFAPNRPEHMEIARRMILEKRYTEADAYIAAEILDKRCQSYQLAGDLVMEFSGLGAPEKFRRILDLERGVLSMNFNCGETVFRREFFTSFPDDVFAGKISSDHSGSVSAVFSLQSLMHGECRALDERTLIFNGVCPIHNRDRKIVWNDAEGNTGVKFQIMLQIGNKGGTVEVSSETLTVKNSDEVEIRLRIASNFIDYATTPSADHEELTRRNHAALSSIEKRSYEELLERHENDFRELFRRTVLTLPENFNSKLSTAERIRRESTDPDPSLSALLFNYGRYLAISASRPGSKPMNLQGIWNDKLCPEWACNYTTNINLEMNYWFENLAGLPECNLPLFDFLCDLSKKGALAARQLYHCRGWCAHHNSDIWAFCTVGASIPNPPQPPGGTAFGFWPMGGAWLCRHIFEHWRFTEDLEFLRKFYPVMKDAGLFLLDFLQKLPDGTLGTIPSTSPENKFIDPATGKPCGAGIFSTMDWSITEQLFHDILESAKILRLSEDYLQEFAEALSNLHRPGIGKHGQLLEFHEDFEEFEPLHRHVSHLYGAYPAENMTPDKNPDLFEAAKVSLMRRGFRSVGWGLSWRLCLLARFGDGAGAAQELHHLIHLVTTTETDYCDKGGVYPNLVNASPPLQIDGSCSAVAGIGELLVQSHRKNVEGEIILELLPALPPLWKSGRFAGVRARGNLILDFEWSDGLLSSLTIQAQRMQTVELHWNCRTVSVKLDVGINPVTLG